jgi:TolA-binding protein
MRVVVGDTTVVVRDAKLEVVSKRGAIAHISVFAGSVQLTVRGQRVVIEAGETWEPPPPLTTGAAAFREAWTALREERYDDAIAAFDRATDSVVAEDALYWSAIACQRAGKHGEAVTRFRQLVAQYPDSPRVVEAKAAIARE